MDEIVQNTSLFEILDDPKFRLEAVSEASSEVSQLPIDPNRDTGLVLIVDQKSSKGVKKVRNNPKNKRPRKLPNLSSSPGFGRREETRESPSSTYPPTPIQNGIANGGGHGVSETKLTNHVRADLSGTTREGKNENRFQSKAQIFEQGEGTALLRRGIKKNLAKKKGVRRKLPSVPEHFMDIIDQVREANKTPFADADEEYIDRLTDTESLERSSSLETEQKLHDDEEHLDKFRVLTPITEDIENEKEDAILSFDESLDINHNKSDTEGTKHNPNSESRNSFTSTNIEKLNETEISKGLETVVITDQYNKQLDISLHPESGEEESKLEIKVPDESSNKDWISYSRDENDRQKETDLDEFNDRNNLGFNDSVEDLETTVKINDLREELGKQVHQEHQSIHSLESIRGNGGSETDIPLEATHLEYHQQERMSSEEREEQKDEEGEKSSPRGAGDNQLFHMLLDDEYEDDFDDESTSTRSISIASDGDHQRHSDNEPNLQEDQRRGTVHAGKLRRDDAIDEGDEEERAEEEEKQGMDDQETGEDSVVAQRPRSEITDEGIADSLVDKETSQNAEDKSGRELDDETGGTETTTDSGFMKDEHNPISEKLGHESSTNKFVNLEEKQKNSAIKESGLEIGDTISENPPGRSNEMINKERSSVIKSKQDTNITQSFSGREESDQLISKNDSSDLKLNINSPLQPSADVKELMKSEQSQESDRDKSLYDQEYNSTKKNIVTPLTGISGVVNEDLTQRRRKQIKDREKMAEEEKTDDGDWINERQTRHEGEEEMESKTEINSDCGGSKLNSSVNATKQDLNFNKSSRAGEDQQRVDYKSLEDESNNQQNENTVDMIGIAKVEEGVPKHIEDEKVQMAVKVQLDHENKRETNNNLSSHSEEVMSNVQFDESENHSKSEMEVLVNVNQAKKPKKSALKIRQGPTNVDYPTETQSNGTDGTTVRNLPHRTGDRIVEEISPSVHSVTGTTDASEIDVVEGVNIEMGERDQLAERRPESDPNKFINNTPAGKTGDKEEVPPRKKVVTRKTETGTTGNEQSHNNRHEGHNCPRELRRLERLKEKMENEDATVAAIGAHPGTDNSEQFKKKTKVQEGDTNGEQSSTFPGQSSEEAATSPLIDNPSGKKRRKKKSSDPFDGLPVIKPWHIHQQEQKGIREKPKGRKRHEKRFKVSQFDDPFNQMVWMLFRSADKDGNGKLNKKELNLVLQSPKLELSLTPADVKKLFTDCCTEEDIDAKTYELSFEEFALLGRFLLMLYYSKLDESSQSKWCILDKGNDYGLIYFNKLTGEARLNKFVESLVEVDMFVIYISSARHRQIISHFSPLPKSYAFLLNKDTSIPTDYYGNILHEPDLLELAIYDLFDDADIDEDGKINLIDFLRILRSEDFGLFLTNTDTEEIMQYFINTRGREVMVQFDEFVPLAKRMILTVYKARDPSMHEWCHLYTKNVGSFWFNKRTGQADRHPPTSLVRTQQDMLEHRSREIEVFMEVAEDLHHTKEDLQRETLARQELENQLAELRKEHDATKKELAKTTSNLEKSREEVDQKSKQIIYFEKEKVKRQHLIESLQDRAEEADRIEANLESLRNVLQSTQTTVREKEFDVKDLSSDLEETKKQLAESRELAANLQDKIDDLVVQLREEIRRNERVEKELERTKSYKSEKVEVEDILKETKEELQLRMNQLTHARYEIRDSKSRIRKLETELNNYPDLQSQLAEKEKEISLLKEEMERLEAQLMEDIRRAAREPRPSAKRFRWNKVRNVESLDDSHDCSDPLCPVNGRNACRPESSQVWAFKKTEKTQTQSKGSFLELLSNVEHSDDMDVDEELNIYDLYEPQYPVISPHRVRASSASGDRSRLMRPKSSAGRIESRRQSKLPKGVLLYEEDYLLARFVKEGDRVRIKKSGVQILGMKPSDLRSATVRYVGQLEQEGGEHMLFVGLHMDDAVGNTNGILEGKRYFYTKRKHGKMVRITEVLYIYNTKTTSFDKLNDLVEEYKSSRRKPWYQSPDEGSRLIKVT